MPSLHCRLIAISLCLALSHGGRGSRPIFTGGGPPELGSSPKLLFPARLPSSIVVTARQPSVAQHYVETEEKPMSRRHLQADHGIGVFRADGDRKRELSREIRASGRNGTALKDSRGQPETNQDLTLQQDTFCEFGALPAFIRVPQALIMGIPTIVTAVDVVSCAGFCRNNTEPASRGRRLCQGFNFQDSGTATCEFFDVEARLGPLNRNVGVRSFYFDKICLEGVQLCSGRPYAFEAVPDAQLQGNVRKTLVVSDEAECLSACLKEATFTCMSVNFVRTGRVCEMSQYSRRGKLRDFATNVQGVDYYENNCLTKRNRCEGGGMFFVKTFNSEIRGFDASEGQETLNSCLQKCLDSDDVFCRSAEYDRGTSECLVSDEDSFSMPGMVSTAEAVGIDLYEPVCIPGEIGKEDRKVKCKRPYLFEKVLNTALNVPEHFRVLNGLTPEDCMMTCSEDDKCKSINFNRDSQTCMLSEYDRRNNTASLGRAFRIDYYENNCQKANTIQGCFFTLEGVGRVVRPEFRNREVEATSSVDCKMSCIRRGESCKAVSFDEAERTCLHSQLDTAAAPFDLLAQVDLNFDTYVKGECVFERQGAATFDTTAGAKAGTDFTSLAPASPTAASGTRLTLGDDTEPRGRQVRSAPLSSDPSLPLRLDLGTPGPVSRLDAGSPGQHHFLLPQFDHGAELYRRAFAKGKAAPKEAPEESYERSRRDDDAFPVGLAAPGCKVLKLHSRRRKLRRFYSNNHLETSSLDDCRLMCVTMTAYRCLSVSYSTRSLLCSLSELDPAFKNVSQLTQYEADYDFYTTSDCRRGGDGEGRATPATSWQPPSQRRSPPTLDLWTTSTKSPTISTPRPRPRSQRRRRPQRFTTVTTSPTTELITAPFRRFRTLPPSLLHDDASTKSPPSLSTAAPDTRRRPTQPTILRAATKLGRDPIPTASALTSSFGSDFTFRQFGNGGGGGFGTPLGPRRPTAGSAPVFDDRFGIALAPSSVQLSAICSPDGVNVSVSTIGTYTGAIYAAERFSFCRNLVTGQSGFWLFLPRPDINSACNTIMVNEVLSGVIVISNDNVRPYDVTTKDDLFYQVSCDFNGGGEGGKVIVTGGLVVGGPTPRVVAGAGLSSNFDASLRVLRNGIPVQNVLIGEQLTLNIDSPSDPARMMLMNCNVSRIGGSGPLPQPLTIIDNGCPAVTQVVGAIERGSNGLFSPLTAFRIDGSAEIQIVCMVMFCPQQCQPVICPRGDGSTVPSFGRRKREVDAEEEETVVESVNGRLKVFVEGEEGAPTYDEISESASRATSGSCIAESTFVAVTAGLGLAVALLMTCLSCMLCRRSWMVSLQHKLLSEQYGRSVISSTESQLTDRSSSHADSQVIRAIHPKPHRSPYM